ncbi:hypothetical protein [Candidatus Marimicrobium litorale]|uniref:hypothetical protein n=1 Tax=Candidatus Marimicrobium litorale TaxID=2518991 RepID=UPI0024300CCB|nr:hypothetical protein [Candidatus Marimicrobium litorale]
MKHIIAVATLALIPSMFAANAQADVLCESLANPGVQKVFDGGSCPQGWYVIKVLAG